LFAGHRLAVSARLDFDFTLRYFEGKQTTLTITSAGPRVGTACLVPGTTKVTRRC
jgi:hypothetical protein